MTEYTPFKMKGFSGFGNSPAKDKTSPPHEHPHKEETKPEAKKQELSEEDQDKMKRAVTQGKISKWNKANPDATNKEMNEYISSVQGGGGNE